MLKSQFIFIKDSQEKQKTKSKMHFTDIRLPKAFCLAFIGFAGLIIYCDAAVTINNNNNNELSNNELQYQASGDKRQRMLSPQIINQNDLREQPEMVASIESQQAQRTRKEEVGNALINGNQATYVEPPANFKPIIYDYDRQSQRRPLLDREDSLVGEEELLQKNGQAFVPLQLDPMLISSSGSDYPINEQDIQRLRRVQSQETPSQPERFDNRVDGTTTNTLKPSVGRWMDWHDMSVEPEIASSELATPSAPVKTKVGPATYRTRYLHASGMQQSRTRQPGVSFAGDSVDNIAGLKGGDSVSRASSASSQQQHHHQLNQATKGGQLPVKSLPTLNHQFTNTQGNKNLIKSNTNPHQIDEQQVSQQNSIGAIKSISQQEHQQQQQQQQPQQLNQPLLPQSGNKNSPQQQLNQPQQQQRRLKRRRKSKAKLNTEVRIQQLVSDSQAKEFLAEKEQFAKRQLLLINAHPKQVNGLPANQLFYSSSLAENASQQQDKHFNIQRALLLDHKNQQRHEERVQPEQRVPFKLIQPASTLNQAATDGRQRIQPATIIGGNGQHQQQAGQNRTKVVKRRRIKSQLPVGLSSWLLGGIRDLDGRHWQLPSDVISKLAVNDVDLVDRQPNAKPVEPPSAGSVQIVAVGSGLEVQEQKIGINSQSTPMQPAPNKLVPR